MTWAKRKQIVVSVFLSTANARILITIHIWDSPALKNLAQSSIIAKARKAGCCVSAINVGLKC